MKPEKSKKSVSDMGVFKDLRELLSTAQEKAAPAEAEAARYQEELENYRRLVESQREELERLRSEREALLRELESLRVRREEAAPGPDIAGLKAEVARLEAYRDELARAVADAEELLRLRLSELLRKVARAFESSGFGDAGLQFRSAADYLESPEDFAYLLRVLLKGAR